MRRGSLMRDVEWMARGRKGGTDRMMNIIWKYMYLKDFNTDRWNDMCLIE